MLLRNMSRIINFLTYQKKEVANLPYHILCSTVRDTHYYNVFIPWCKQAQILKRISPNQNYTKLTISFNDLKEISYTSHVTIQQQQQRCVITSLCKDSPLKYLKSVWTITKRTQHTVDVSYFLDFQFDSLVYQLTSSLFLNIMGKSMWDIFLKRANSINRTQYKPINHINEPKYDDKPINTSQNLAEYLSTKPKLSQIIHSNKQIEQQVKKIDRRLSHTKNYPSKMAFQIKNLLTHHNIELSNDLNKELT